MVMIHLEEAIEYSLKNRQDVKKALFKGAEWLRDQGIIQTKWGNKLDWSIEWGACIYFTHSYFMISSALARLGKLDPENKSHWQHESLELLRYVRTRLWDHKFGDYDNDGPFRPSECGLTYGAAWFGQSLGWCLYMLDDCVDQFNY